MENKTQFARPIARHSWIGLLQVLVVLGLSAMLAASSAGATDWSFKPSGREISTSEGISMNERISLNEAILLPFDYPQGDGAAVTPLSVERTMHLNAPTVSTFLVEFAPGGSAMLHRAPSSGYVLVYVLSGTIRASAWQAGVGIYHVGETWVEPAFANSISAANASTEVPARALVVLVTDDQQADKQPTAGIR